MYGSVDEWLAPSQIRVMVVDGHDLLRAGIRAILESEPDMSVVAEAASPEEAVSAAATHAPDVLVMDALLAQRGGLEALRVIRDHQPGVRVMMIASRADEDAILASVQSAASGLVLKQIKGPDLAHAVREVGKGHGFVDREALKAVLGQPRSPLRNHLRQLTPQERRVLSLVAEGKTNRQIGRELRLAEKTVRNYVSAVLAKLEVSSRTHAAAILIRQAVGEQIAPSSSERGGGEPRRRPTRALASS